MDTTDFIFYHLKLIKLNGEEVNFNDGYATLKIEGSSYSENWKIEILTREDLSKFKKGNYMLDATDMDGIRYQGELKLDPNQKNHQGYWIYTLVGTCELERQSNFKM